MEDLFSSIVYYPETKFNGVLIILREPHDDPDKSEKDCLEGNRKWFYQVMSEEHFNFKISTYRNRFKEMLKVCGREPDISSTAFTNVKLTGGGLSASTEYWEKDKSAIVSEIISIVNPNTVFVLREIFDLVVTDNASVEKGIKYKNKTTLRKATVNGITYYEIYHPSYRRKIVI